MSTHNRNTIYLVRHGENPANITHEFSYKYVDYSLTAKGIQQADQTGAYFLDKQVDAVYASPLKRAIQTAEHIAHPLGLSVTQLEQFREVNVGSLEGRPPTDENWAIHNHIVDAWFEGDHDAIFPDGENYHMLLARMREGLRQITRNKNGETLVVVGHGGIFTRTMQDICPSLDLNELVSKQNYNCSISKLALTTNTETGHVEGTLLLWAYVGHLHGDAAQVLPGTSLPGKLPATKQI